VKISFLLQISWRQNVYKSTKSKMCDVERNLWICYCYKKQTQKFLLCALSSIRKFNIALVIKLQRNRFSEPVVVKAILNFLLEIDGNAHDKNSWIFFLQQQQIHKIHTQHKFCFLLIRTHFGAMKFAIKMKISHS
jgi:hypothetical protein